MRNEIPECETWSVNNKCTWSLLKRAKSKDPQLDITRSWSDTGNVIYSVEPSPVSVRDNILIQQNQGLAPTETLVKIWIKDILLDFYTNEYALRMIARTTPCGESLDLIPGNWYLLQNADNLGLKSDQWVFMVRKN